MSLKFSGYATIKTHACIFNYVRTFIWMKGLANYIQAIIFYPCIDNSERLLKSLRSKDIFANCCSEGHFTY